MKTPHVMLALSVASLLCAAPAMAQTVPADQDQAPKADVVQRGPDGHASAVQAGGQDYAVCTKTRQDSCIEPRAAGLKWGNRPLKNWPGKPASSIDGDQGHIAQ